jgi:hypothetical protein
VAYKVIHCLVEGFSLTWIKVTIIRVYLFELCAVPILVLAARHDCIAKFCLFLLLLAEGFSSAQVSIFEVSSVEVGSPEIGLFEISLVKQGIFEIGIFEVSLFEIGFVLISVYL